MVISHMIKEDFQKVKNPEVMFFASAPVLFLNLFFIDISAKYSTKPSFIAVKTCE